MDVDILFIFIAALGNCANKRRGRLKCDVYQKMWKRERVGEHFHAYLLVWNGRIYLWGYFRPNPSIGCPNFSSSKISMLSRTKLDPIPIFSNFYIPLIILFFIIVLKRKFYFELNCTILMYLSSTTETMAIIVRNERRWTIPFSHVCCFFVKIRIIRHGVGWKATLQPVIFPTSSSNIFLQLLSFPLSIWPNSFRRFSEFSFSPYRASIPNYLTGKEFFIFRDLLAFYSIPKIRGRD